MRKLVVGLLVALALGACTSAQQNAQQSAQNKAEDRSYYIPTHDIEYDNYQARAKLADNPASIIWCTVFTYDAAPFTVPIVGKLTSSTKRPFPSDPGPDGMYGASDDFRYGFAPGGSYWDYTGVQMVCTTQPTTWQTSQTTLVLAADAGLGAAETQAQAAIARGDQAGAQRILDAAILAAQPTPPVVKP